MIELTSKSEISELIKPDPIKSAEENTPTFDLLEQVQEHEEFGLEDGAFILEDKGLRLEHIPPYPRRITGKFRVSCEDTLIEISGLGESERTVIVIHGEAQQIVEFFEENKLEWSSMQEWLEINNMEWLSISESVKAEIQIGEAETHYEAYVVEICKFLTDIYTLGCSTLYSSRRIEN